MLLIINIYMRVFKSINKICLLLTQHQQKLINILI